MWRSRLLGVYPRVCGGSPLRQQRQRPHHGLSPRVRGKPWASTGRGRGLWSIPACAGEAPVTASMRMLSRVYPRVCGGSMLGMISACHSAGLSPRVRGKLLASSSAPMMLRSIPACAGEAAAWLLLVGDAGVYPRVCGGSWYDCVNVRHSLGLSPRVRGKQRIPAPTAKM